MKIAYLIGIIFLVTACTSVPQWPQRSYADRMQRLSAIHAWTIRAQVVAADRDDANHVDWYWSLKSPNRYHMVLMAPLGLQSARLSETPHGAMLQVSDEPIRKAPSAEQLLTHYWGHDWPIDAMRYWIRGMPAPGAKQIQLDGVNHITQIQQSGWTVHLGAYEWVDGVALPTDFLLRKMDMTIHCHISHWSIKTFKNNKLNQIQKSR